MNVFDSFVALYRLFNFTRLCSSFSYICNLVLEDGEKILQYTSCILMWDITKFPHWHVYVDILL